MIPTIHFLAQKLNGGNKPIGYYDDNPTDLPGLTPLLEADWRKFVDRLDANEQIPKSELLSWLLVLVSVAARPTEPTE